MQVPILDDFQGACASAFEKLYTEMNLEEAEFVFYSPDNTGRFSIRFTSFPKVLGSKILQDRLCSCIKKERFISWKIKTRFLNLFLYPLDSGWIYMFPILSPILAILKKLGPLLILQGTPKGIHALHKLQRIQIGEVVLIRLCLEEFYLFKNATWSPQFKVL